MKQPYLATLTLEKPLVVTAIFITVISQKWFRVTAILSNGYFDNVHIRYRVFRVTVIPSDGQFGNWPFWVTVDLSNGHFIIFLILTSMNRLVGT